MVDSFRLPVDGESFDDYQHAFHQYYATPEGAGYQQIRQEIVEDINSIALKAIDDEPAFEDEMPNEIRQIVEKGISVEAFQGFATWAVKETKKNIKKRLLDSLLSEPAKKGDNK